MTWQEEYLHKYYQSRPGWVPLDELWRATLEEYIPTRGPVLDLGAGPSNRSSRFVSEIAERVVGADVDPRIKTNQWLDEAHLIVDGNLPFPDNSFDAVVSNWVAEHIEDPQEHLIEIRRVLRPGGVYVFRTPNLLHYMALTARVTPLWVHRLLAKRLMNDDVTPSDPYPTFYRLNTRRACRRNFQAAGLKLERCQMIESNPLYGQSSKLLFHLFMAYERAVNLSPRLERFRFVIHAAGREPDSPRS